MDYFWKKDGDTYHWHYICSKVPADARQNPDWVVSDKPPSGREKCNECTGKDKK